MATIQYKIEFKWRLGNISQSLIVVTNDYSKNGIISVTDEIYSTYNRDFKELIVYYFNSLENANQYIYSRFVKARSEEDCLQRSGCRMLLREKMLRDAQTNEILKCYNVNSLSAAV